jgi:hypothetical protein
LSELPAKTLHVGTVCFEEGFVVGVVGDAGGLGTERGDAFTSEAYEYLGTAVVVGAVTEDAGLPAERFNGAEMRLMGRAAVLLGCKMRLGRCDGISCGGVSSGTALCAGAVCCAELCPKGRDAAFDKPLCACFAFSCALAFRCRWQFASL